MVFDLFFIAWQWKRSICDICDMEQFNVKKLFVTQAYVLSYM